MSAPSSTLEKTKRDSANTVTGLRGLACLLVVLSHCYRYGGPFTDTANLLSSVPYFYGYGYIGVDLFFVVSGFALGHRYLVLARENINWRDYYRKRVFKILPLFYLTVIPFIAGGLLSKFWGMTNFLATAVPGTWKEIAYGLCLISPVICGAYWTLCIQLRWYLVFPILVVLAQRIGTAFLYISSIFISVAIFFVNKYDLHHDLTASTWWQTIYFLPEFVLGILLADINNRKMTWLSAVPVIGEGIARYKDRAQFLLIGTFGLSLFGYTHLLPNYQRLDLLRLFVCTVVVALLFLLCKTSPLLQRIVTSRAVIFISTISYSVYLVHEPIIRQLQLWTANSAIPYTSMVAIYVICMPLLVLCAGAIWFLCAERRLGRRN